MPLHTRMVAVLACTAITSTLLAGGRGAGTPPEFHFGMSHSALGGASLSTDPTGRLVVSNIGSSGQDGVSVDLGRTTGFAMQCDIGPSGALATGSRTTLRSHFEDGDIPSEAQLHLQESNGGECDVLLDYTGQAATCIHVELLINDVRIRDIRIVHPPATPPGTWLVHGNIGSSSDGTALTCEWKVEEGEKAVSIFRPSSGTWLLALPGQSPVDCDQVAITLEGLPPVSTVMTQCDVLGHGGGGGGGAGGTIGIDGESLRVRYKGWDGTIKGRAAVTGDAHIAGVAGDDICAGCYECCHPDNGDALTIASGVSVANIGSSGQDGVRVFCRNYGSPWFFPEIELLLGPIDLSDAQAALEFRATATFSDMSSRTTSCALANDALSGGMQLSADFSSLSSAEALLEVSSGGASTGSVVVPNMPGEPLATMLSGTGLPLHVTRCRNLAGDPASGQSGFALHFDESFLMIVGGQLLLGDELRVRASDSTLHTEVVSEMICRGKHFPSAVISCRASGGRIGPPPPSSIVFGGMVHTALGQCVLSSRDIDDDGRADLLISNIGSSGQDGVEVSLGQACGAKFDCRFSPTLPGIPLDSPGARVLIDAIDDPPSGNPAGLSQVMATMDVQCTGPGSGTFSATMSSAHLRHITLLKRTAGGELVRVTLPFVNGEVWPISVAATESLSLNFTKIEYDYKRNEGFADGSGNDASWNLHCVLGGMSSGGSHAGVTVSHPLHGTITDVEEIIVSQCGPPDGGTIDRVQMHLTAGSVCNPCTACVRNSDVNVAFAGEAPLSHCALGQTRLVPEDCDDTDPTFDTTLWVASIGSSGQDGVAVFLPWPDRDEDCDGVALGDVVGATAIFRPSTGEWLHSTNSMNGSILGEQSPPESLASVSLDSSNPAGGTTVSCNHAWAPNLQVNGTVRDQFGNAVASLNGLPPGTRWVEMASHDDTGAYGGSFVVIIVTTLAGAPSMQILSSTQTLTWPSDQTFTFVGMPPVVGRSLEVVATPPAGTIVTGDLHLNALVLTRQSPPGATHALGIVDEIIDRLPAAPPCPADIAPAATNGDHQVNVADLLAVIIGWGACANCPATPCHPDINHDCVVGVADLLNVITHWGACP